MLLRVVADDDGAGPQVRGDQLERRPRHRNPDVDQHEIHRPVDLLERLAQIALPKVDVAAQSRLREMFPRGLGFLGLVFGADDDAFAAAGPQVVAHRRGQVERRDAVGRADLDDAAGVVGAAELVAELGLVAIQRHQLVAAECLDAGRVAFRRVMNSHRLALLVAPGMQPRQQAFQFRVVKDAHDPILKYAIAAIFSSSPRPGAILQPNYCHRLSRPWPRRTSPPCPSARSRCAGKP